MAFVQQVMAGAHPMHVMLREEDGLWRAQVVEHPHVEVYAKTYNTALEKAIRRCAEDVRVA